MLYQTKTTNRLHFEDLEPHRFEDLCSEILQKDRNWKKFYPFGRKGTDDGLDIFCEDVNGHKWFCQCKRYKEISSNDIMNIIDKIVTKNDNVDNGTILLIVACNVSKRSIKYFEDYASKNHFSDAIIWTASYLEAILYNKYDYLLNKYFGIMNNGQKEKENRIRYGHKVEKEFAEKLIDLRPFNTPAKLMELVDKPYLKFKYDSTIVRSIDDETYPGREENENASGWYKCFFCDTTEKGVIISIAPWSNVTIAINKQTQLWRKVEENDAIFDTEIVVDTEPVVLIPYYNIIDIWEEGDDFFPIPHLFCKFDFNLSPFTEKFLKYRKLNVYFKEGKPIEQMDLIRIYCCPIKIGID